ncbi:MAG: endonuclease III [Proteobacteria bacterium]|nr:endonuclease III [Pseudomonadota bacterium]
MQFSLPFEKSILAEIHARLLATFGPQRDTWRLDPTSQLVNAMISSKTRDEVSLRAFRRLMHSYASWDLLVHAAPATVEQIIQPVTFAELKAIQLPRALRMIAARTGSLDLHFLMDWDEEMAMQWLNGLPGVGAKIAATVLNFSSLRKRTLAVDTHLLRIGERLGLLPGGADYERGYDRFMHRVPDDWTGNTLYEIHWLLKYLGQSICTHASPACADCPLQDICPSCPPSLSGPNPQAPNPQARLSRPQSAAA